MCIICESLAESAKIKTPSNYLLEDILRSAFLTHPREYAMATMTEHEKKFFGGGIKH